MKNKDFTKEDLKSFKEQLEELKKDLLDTALRTEKEENLKLAQEEMSDEVDLASATVAQDLTHKLLARDKKRIHEIDHALSKIVKGDGEFGLCEVSGEKIPIRRLKNNPAARYGVREQENLERSIKSGRGVNDDESGEA